jgi:DNA-binding CsgD family transcriptional regulator/sugar-specific transcriptional regulator TrmB
VLEGITGNAGRAYRYLLAVVDAAASDVAAELETSMPVATDLVEELTRHGLAERRADRYAAVPPAVSLQPRLLAREDELRRARVAVDELLEIHRELSGGVGRYVELIESRDELQRRVLKLQTDATLEYLALVKATQVAVRTGESPVLMAEQVRAVFELDILQDERFRELVRDKTKPNYENRVYPGVPMRLAIADQQTAILSIRQADDTATALHVNAPSLVLALCTYFETIWAAAAPMLLARGSSEELDPDRLGARERELVSMLLAGLTNEAIAAHWGISRRSVVRQVQELMTRTGSTSRVHLGWEAHRRGWLS